MGVEGGEKGRDKEDFNELADLVPVLAKKCKFWIFSKNIRRGGQNSLFGVINSPLLSNVVFSIIQSRTCPDY